MAATAVPLAKLTRPRVGQAIARERLFAAIDRLRDRPVVWVAAQPGAGKTTLLASFLRARKLKELWYQVDPGDADPASFFYHLGLAAQGLGRGNHREPLPLLTAEYLADVPGFARRFFRTLYQRMGAKSALVLDNLQEAPEESPFHRILATAFEELPDGVGAYVASRTAPPAIYAPLLARSRLGVIEAAEMRLTREEVAAIVHERDDLDDAAVASLLERSGGWAAGVTLLLERAGRGESLEAAGSVEMLHQVFAHFVEALIEEHFAGDMDTLLQLGFVTRITPAIASDLCGPEAEALLEKLHRRNLFTERRRIGHELTYQFHHLLQAFLRGKARSTWTAERWRQSAARAAAVLEQHGGGEEALPLLRELGDWAGLARVLNAIAPAILAQERRRTVLEWVASMPEAERDAHPWMHCWKASALAIGSPREARGCFERAHAGFVKQGDALGRLLSVTGIVFTHSFELAKLDEMDPWLAELAAIVDGRPAFPKPNIELQAMSALLFGWDFRMPPDESRGERCAARVRELLEVDIDVNDKIMAGGLLLAHCYHRGRVAEGERVIALAQQCLASRELRPAQRALWWLQVGWFSCFRGDLAGGFRAIETSLGIRDASGLAIPAVDVYSQICLALLAVQEGDYLRAEAYRARAETYWRTFRRMDMAAGAMLRGVLASHRGDRSAARVAAREHYELASEVGVRWQVYNGYLHSAYVAAEDGRHADCAGFLEKGREWIAGTAHAPFAYQADLIEAFSAWRRDDREAMRSHLARGLAAGSFDHAMFFLRVQPRLLSRLFAAALAEGIEVDTVRRAIREVHIPPPDLDVPGWPWPLTVRTLGAFEVRRDGRPLEFSRKAPRKTLQLLKAIVAQGGSNVPEQSLLDALWSDEEGDAASKSLGAAVLRLRNLLGDADAVVQQAGTLSLDRSRVWVDAWAFEAGTDVTLYTGSFLPEEEGVPWPVPMRERLRARFIQKVGERGAALEKAGRHDEAIELYMRGIDADSIVEPFYQGLMRCYVHLDRRSEAASAYRRLKQILSVTLGLPPSAGTERLFKSLHLNP